MVFISPCYLYLWKLSRGQLLDDLRGLHQDRRRDGQSERLGGLEVDHEVEFRRLLDRQVGRFRASEDPVDVVGGPSEHPSQAWPIRHQAARPGEPGVAGHRRYGSPGCRVEKPRWKSGVE